VGHLDALLTAGERAVERRLHAETGRALNPSLPALLPSTTPRSAR